jgi:glyoxylase-like metal-dependent hydrolase (beta-lactamase superfamily II)
MTSETIHVGDVRIDAIHDTNFDLDPSRPFPQVPEETWREYQEYLTPEGKVRLVITCYLIRSQGHTMLVDTGMRVAPGVEGEGTLLDGLRGLGVQPEDVQTVVFSHLHGDHVGWNISRDDGQPRATFPNARYVIQRAEWEWFTRPEVRERPGVVNQLLPLEALGVLELRDGDFDLTSEVRAHVTSGHTPGHTTLEIESKGQRAFVFSDIAVHHVQLAQPDWFLQFDSDAEAARRMRWEYFDRLAVEGTLVIANHFPAPGYGHIVSDGTTWRWRPLA